MRFVLTTETKHSEHVNAIGFFFFYFSDGNLNNGGGAANGDKRRDKGLNTKWRERERERERERIKCILLLGLEIRIECNKQGIINEILVRMLALMMVFFLPLDLLRSNGLKKV